MLQCHLQSSRRMCTFWTGANANPKIQYFLNTANEWKLPSYICLITIETCSVVLSWWNITCFHLTSTQIHIYNYIHMVKFQSEDVCCLVIFLLTFFYNATICVKKTYIHPPASLHVSGVSVLISLLTSNYLFSTILLFIFSLISFSVSIIH